MTERVKRALLSMQRRDWEHGVAAQAFLEAGDKDIAVFSGEHKLVQNKRQRTAL